MERKGNLFLKEMNGFMLNVTINVSFLQLPGRGRSCHPGHYICVFMTRKRGTRPPLLTATRKFENIFPSLPSRLAPLSSPEWRVCPHLCWDKSSCVSGFS